jgi:hypothetical protein
VIAFKGDFISLDRWVGNDFSVTLVKVVVIADGNTLGTTSQRPFGRV